MGVVHVFQNIVSSAADVVVFVRLPRPMEGNGMTPIFRSLQNVLGMSVVCEMCMCLARGGVGGEWI